MRLGELTGLRWQDVDLDTGVISVRQSLKHRNGELWEGDTKTKQSRRRFKIFPVAVTALKLHQARQAAERLKAGNAWTETGLVFTTKIGCPINPANLRRAFRALVKAAGVPDKQPTENCPKPGQWHPHEMRHSAGSYMDAMGVPPKRVASKGGRRRPSRVTRSALARDLARLHTGAPGGWPALAVRAPDADRCGAEPMRRTAGTARAPTPPWPGGPESKIGVQLSTRQHPAERSGAGFTWRSVRRRPPEG
jgi:Phage integrase family